MRAQVGAARPLLEPHLAQHAPAQQLDPVRALDRQRQRAVVDGQPRAARRAGRSKEVVPPEAIAPSQGGMGLGFFIARTLLERTGGKVTVGAGSAARGKLRGARVAVRWPRQALEPVQVSQGAPAS